MMLVFSLTSENVQELKRHLNSQVTVHIQQLDYPWGSGRNLPKYPLPCSALQVNL